jgi:hypothetical protein
MFLRKVDHFKEIFEYLIASNPFEGQIDTGNMMQAFIERSRFQ